MLVVVKPFLSQGALKDVYLKGALGWGSGKDVYMCMITEEGKRVNANVGGMNLEGALGYKLDPQSAIEVNIGYQKSNGEPKISKGEYFFKKMPLTLTYIRKLYTQPRYSLYGGGGAGFYLSPEIYTEDSDGTQLVGTYDRSFGFHILERIDYKLKNSFVFGEFKYVFAKYKLKKVKFNEQTIPQSWVPEWQKLNGNQLIFNLGVRFKLPQSTK